MIIMSYYCTYNTISKATLYYFQKRFDEIENVAMIDRNTIPSKKKIIVKGFIEKKIKILVATHAVFSFKS